MKRFLVGVLALIIISVLFAPVFYMDYLVSSKLSMAENIYNKSSTLFLVYYMVFKITLWLKKVFEL